ncbi:MAG: FG-GAP repeat protein [Myxococcales bacterium]|nr:FG-GAP repeat protein [Myxococcales bacterium]
MTRSFARSAGILLAIASVSCAQRQPTEVVFELTSSDRASIEAGALVVAREGATEPFGPPVTVAMLDAQLLVRVSRVDDPTPLLFTYTGRSRANEPLKQRARVRFVRERTVFASMSIDPRCTEPREAECAARGAFTCGAGGECVALDVPARERLPDGGVEPLDVPNNDAASDALDARDAAPSDADASIDAVIDAVIDARDEDAVDALSMDVPSDSGTDARNVSDGSALPPPRLIGPISTTVSMTRQPRFQYVPAAGVTTHSIEFCSDRSCSTVLSQALIGMVAYTPPTPLPAGWTFWRMRSRVGFSLGAPSAVWQVYVPNNLVSNRVSTNTGALDLDGDGLSDAACGSFRAPGAAGTEVGLFRVVYGYRDMAPRRFVTVAGSQLRGHFGISIASAGDINGDGYGDLIVGAENEGSTDSGRAHVFFGSATGISVTPDRTFVGPATGARFGAAVTGLGDVNGDGYSDVAIGAPGSATRAGEVYFVPGGPVLAVAPTPLSAMRLGDEFGAALSAGDTNGDGTAELAIGAPNAANGAMMRAGSVVLYRYNAVLSQFEALTSLAGAAANAQLGISVALNGDINGDGLSDLVASAIGAGGTAGALVVHAGRTTAPGLESTALFTAMGATGDNLGNSVTHLGDLNGDGVGDFAAGAWTAGMNNGRWEIYRGQAASRPVLWGSKNGLGGIQLGTRVGGVGDFNGDGFADLLSTAWLANGVGSVPNGGTLRVYFGNPMAPMGAVAETTLLSGTVANELMGAGLAGR